MFNDRLFAGVLLSLISMLALSCPKSWSDSITFREAEKNFLEYFAPDSEFYTSTKGNFKMKGLFFANVDSSALTNLLVTNTDVTVSIGDWSGGGRLGDDHHYRNGDLRARIAPIVYTNSCMVGKKIRAVVSPVGTTTFACSSKGIEISVRSHSTPCTGFYSAIADEIAGQRGAVTTILAVSVVLSNDVIQLRTNINVTVTGNALVKNINKRGTQLSLNSVRVSGSQ